MLRSLPELVNYLKIGNGRVILDSDYLGNATIDFLEALRRVSPRTSLFVLMDTYTEEGEPEVILSLPYGKNEIRLAQQLSPYLYLTRFRFSAGKINMGVILFLAQKAKAQAEIPNES